MAKASGRQRKNRILSLEQNGALIQEDKSILLFATSFNKSMFGPATAGCNVSLDVSVECVLDDIDIIFLEQELCLHEIRVTLFQMKHNQAAHADGLPTEFYQHFWHMIKKNDLFALFNEFYHVRIDISRLNYGVITILPKFSDASKLQLFRPIC
jgi:hypothetical protein